VTKILITGGRGFLGRNLATHLKERKDCLVLICDKEDSAEHLKKCLIEADMVFHLAGINRPENLAEYDIGNAGLAQQVCQILRDAGRAPKIVFSSSIQATLHNPYGESKAKAEKYLRQFAAETGACVRIYRLKNLFGKWCRPNYNSVTATFCHNIANDLPIIVSNPEHELELS
jgi:UDP-2-acetamido-2,6-beta-L-arabino-hexul-4-ose reductase